MPRIRTFESNMPISGLSGNLQFFNAASTDVKVHNDGFHVIDTNCRPITVVEDACYACINSKPAFKNPFFRFACNDVEGFYSIKVDENVDKLGFNVYFMDSPTLSDENEPIRVVYPFVDKGIVVDHNSILFYDREHCIISIKNLYHDVPLHSMLVLNINTGAHKTMLNGYVFSRITTPFIRQLILTKHEIEPTNSDYSFWDFHPSILHGETDGSEYLVHYGGDWPCWISKNSIDIINTTAFFFSVFSGGRHHAYIWQVGGALIDISSLLTFELMKYTRYFEPTYAILQSLSEKSIDILLSNGTTTFHIIAGEHDCIYSCDFQIEKCYCERIAFSPNFNAPLPKLFGVPLNQACFGEVIVRDRKDLLMKVASLKSASIVFPNVICSESMQRDCRVFFLLDRNLIVMQFFSDPYLSGFDGCIGEFDFSVNQDSIISIGLVENTEEVDDEFLQLQYFLDNRDKGVFQQKSFKMSNIEYLGSSGEHFLGISRNGRRFSLSIDGIEIYTGTMFRNSCFTKNFLAIGTTEEVICLNLSYESNSINVVSEVTLPHLNQTVIAPAPLSDHANLQVVVGKDWDSRSTYVYIIDWLGKRHSQKVILPDFSHFIDGSHLMSPQGIFRIGYDDIHDKPTLQSLGHLFNKILTESKQTVKYDPYDKSFTIKSYDFKDLSIDPVESIQRVSIAAFVSQATIQKIYMPDYEIYNNTYNK
ncbi:hypothetical protein PCE1_004268 [Barthelona sp. PCE]